MSKFQELFGEEMTTSHRESHKPKNDWVQEGDILYPCNGKVSVTDNIVPGIYRVVPSPNPMDNRVGIRYVGEKFDLGVDKLYRTGGEEIQEVIKKTWDNEIFKSKNSNLCSIFSGIKGTGKTITAKQLCNHYVTRYPIFIIDNHFNGGIVGFTQSLDFPCVLLIDEAEKTFSEEQRVSLLKICDGALNQAPKIVLMTMNELAVDPNILSRPGRVRYIQEFNNLPEATCREILKDGLLDQSLIEPIYEVLASLKNVTIDIVKSIMDEVNIYGDLKTVKKYMNIDKADITTSLILMTGVEDKEVPTLIELTRMADEVCYNAIHLTGLRFDGIEGFSKEENEEEGYRKGYNGRKKEFLMPKDVYNFLKKRDCDDLQDLVRKNMLTSFRTEEIGMLKFDVGTYIPNFGRIEKCYGNDWYKVKVDFTGEGSNPTGGSYDPEYDEFDEGSELINNITGLRVKDKEIKQGDYIVAYIYSRPPFTVYSNVNAF